MKAELSEIFCSVQGEGPFIGSRQVFIRFNWCNLSCEYCDTVLGSPSCRVEEVPGARDLYKLENPLGPSRVEGIAESFGRVHSYSLTGGEPLLNAEFIRELELEPLYLETNMTLPEEAKLIKDRVRYVAGDFKLNSALNLERRRYREMREATVESFRILKDSRKRHTFAKFIVGGGTGEEELFSSLQAIKDCIHLAVLQPVTPLSSAPTQRELLRLQKCLSQLVEVRIAPQTHKFLNML